MLLGALFSPNTRAGTSTVAHTGTCPDGTTQWSVKTTYDTESAKVLSVETKNCAGVTRIVTYLYNLSVGISLSSTLGDFTIASTNFTVDLDSKVEIVNVLTLATDYAYSSTVTANTTTAIPSSIGSGIFILVARDPNNTSTVYASKIYVQ